MCNLCSPLQRAAAIIAKAVCDHTYPPDTLSGYQSYCQNSVISHITIGSYVSVRSSRYEARGKFGEHERCVRSCSRRSREQV